MKLADPQAPSARDLQPQNEHVQASTSTTNRQSRDHLPGHRPPGTADASSDRTDDYCRPSPVIYRDGSPRFPCWPRPVNTTAWPCAMNLLPSRRPCRYGVSPPREFNANRMHGQLKNLILGERESFEHGVAAPPWLAVLLAWVIHLHRRQVRQISGPKSDRTTTSPDPRRPARRFPAPSFGATFPQRSRLTNGKPESQDGPTQTNIHLRRG